MVLQGCHSIVENHFCCLMDDHNFFETDYEPPCALARLQLYNIIVIVCYLTLFLRPFLNFVDTVTNHQVGKSIAGELSYIANLCFCCDNLMQWLIHGDKYILPVACFIGIIIYVKAHVTYTYIA